VRDKCEREQGRDGERAAEEFGESAGLLCDLKSGRLLGEKVEQKGTFHALQKTDVAAMAGIATGVGNLTAPPLLCPDPDSGFNSLNPHRPPSVVNQSVTSSTIVPHHILDAVSQECKWGKRRRTSPK